MMVFGRSRKAVSSEIDHVVVRSDAFGEGVLQRTPAKGDTQESVRSIASREPGTELVQARR